jgi:hypothetical protein
VPYVYGSYWRAGDNSKEFFVQRQIPFKVRR